MIHFGVLIFILMPILAILFPAMLLLLGATMLASTAPNSAVSQWLQSGEFSPVAVGCAVAIVLGGGAVLLSSRRRADTTVRLREMVGDSGVRLVKMTDLMWRRLAPAEPPPSIRWFPAMDVAAYASRRNGKPELQISAGLWRAATSEEPIAKAIVAHELAHLVYRDPLSLGVLDAIVTATRGIILATAAFAVVIVLYVLVHESGQILDRGEGIVIMLFAWLRILVASIIVLILLPIGWLALRRQVSLITSLIEIRADIVGAAWTGGLQTFTQIFASHGSVVKTTDRDLIKAVLSPSFSHIPQRERLSILRTPYLIVTPKVEFFILSVTLIFLLPINFASPLLYGGAINYLAMQVLAAALNVAIAVMLIVGSGSGPVRIPLHRLLLLAIASCVITALPRINLEPISYLPMSWLLGLGGAPADWSSFSGDVATTAMDIVQKARSGLVNLNTIAALLISYASLIVLSRTVSQSNVWMRSLVGGMVAMLGSCVAGFDPYRASALPWSDLVETVSSNSILLHGLALAFPVTSVAMIDTLFYGVDRLRRNR